MLFTYQSPYTSLSSMSHFQRLAQAGLLANTSEVIERKLADKQCDPPFCRRCVYGRVTSSHLGSTQTGVNAG